MNGNSDEFAVAGVAMQFLQNGNQFTVVRVTGPAHNMLVLEFVPSIDSGEVVIRDLEVSNGTVNLLATAVKEQVLAGVAEANKKFGTCYVVKSIGFVSSDSPPVGIYAALAHHLVERIRSRDSASRQRAFERGQEAATDR